MWYAFGMLGISSKSKIKICHSLTMQNSRTGLDFAHLFYSNSAHLFWSLFEYLQAMNVKLLSKNTKKLIFFPWFMIYVIVQRFPISIRNKINVSIKFLWFKHTLSSDFITNRKNSNSNFQIPSVTYICLN